MQPIRAFPRSCSPDSQDAPSSTSDTSSPSDSKQRRKNVSSQHVSIALSERTQVGDVLARKHGWADGFCLLLLPCLAIWWCCAFIVAWLCTFLILPSWVLSQRLYWACPFIPYIFEALGPARGWALRVGFEASYCINVITRLLTLPMRRDLPHFYVVGFPKAGTTSLAEHLKRHPAISSPVGLPYHEALSKETHYFEGALGRDCASSALLYRSFFPTVMTRWWAEKVRGVSKWMCFDACPVHACLPYVARRIAHVTPNAKIIIMLRDPTAGVFSAEVMLSDMGVPLPWPSLAQPATGATDARFKGADKDELVFWDHVAQLGIKDTLPAELPRALYMTLSGILRCGQYHQLIQPYLEAFPPENIMLITFDEFAAHTEGVVEDVLRFVGADPQLMPRGKPMQPAMQNAYRGRKMHPSVAAILRAFYRPTVVQMQALLQRDLGWSADKGAPTTK